MKRAPGTAAVPASRALPMVPPTVPLTNNKTPARADGEKGKERKEHEAHQEGAATDPQGAANEWQDQETKQASLQHEALQAFDRPTLPHHDGKEQDKRKDAQLPQAGNAFDDGPMDNGTKINMTKAGPTAANKTNKRAALSSPQQKLTEKTYAT
jgi:hypothetical protein